MKVAVIGSGVSGLAATWALNEYSDHEVHLYEKDDRAGGHANTVKFYPSGQSSKEAVDVEAGFIVITPSTYPNFSRFLELQSSKGVSLRSTDMTLSVSRDDGDFEWSGDSLSAVFCQRKRLLDPSTWRLIYDIFRFNASARALVNKWSTQTAEEIEKTFGEDVSIGTYLERERYSQSFMDNYFIPMTAAIWITPPNTCAADFPARTLLPFLYNHQLLQVTSKPKWWTIVGGSRRYVNAILSELPLSQRHLSHPIHSVGNTLGGRVFIEHTDGKREEFDHVIMATPSYVTLEVLRKGGGIGAEEQRVFEQFRWSHNETVLHSDTRLMPKCREAWSCWNYLTTSVTNADGDLKANKNQVSLSYGINALQGIPSHQTGPVFITINPPYSPAPELTQGRYTYAHPILDPAAIQAQRQICGLQRRRNISFAGAWMNFGFHEDGFTAGLLAATALCSNQATKRENRGSHTGQDGHGAGVSGTDERGESGLRGGVRLPFDIEVMPGSSWTHDPAVVARTRTKVVWNESEEGLRDARFVRVLAVVFSLLEETGIRPAVGFVLACYLRVIAWSLGISL